MSTTATATRRPALPPWHPIAGEWAAFRELSHPSLAPDPVRQFIRANDGPVPDVTYEVTEAGRFHTKEEALTAAKVLWPGRLRGQRIGAVRLGDTAP